MRELDLLQSPPGTSHRSYLAILLVMAYYLFAFAPYYMAVAASYIGDLSHLLYAAAQAWSAVLLLLSALFFYATTLSRWRRTVWSWFVNKLSENGYV
jgi:polyferredoxin